MKEPSPDLGVPSPALPVAEGEGGVPFGRQAEAATRDDRDVLALAMRGGKMGAWSRDLATHAMWWSPELEEILGVQPGVAHGESDFLDVVHGEDRPELAEAVSNAVESRSDYAVEFRFRHASGEWRWMEERGRAAYDVEGRPTTLYGLAIDITERVAADRRHAHLAAIVTSSGDAIVSKTLDGVITSWNLGAERLFGYTSQEAVGQSITLIVPPDRGDEEKRILERLRAGELVDHFETVRLTKTGAPVLVSLTISPVRDAKGNLIGASKVARDISDWKRAEAEREELLERARTERARAEEASRLKDDFLATISHELRTPLNSILGWAQMLREGNLDESRTRYAAEVVERSARTQAQLIEDLLDVSSIVTGKLRLNVRPMMPATVVESAIDSLRPAAEAKEIRLSTALDPGAGPVSGDAARIQQVIWNLLSNAIKFTPKGGHVEVRVGRINSHIEIAVSDTGQGIPPSFLPQVFDRFRQAESTSARRHGGLGLGLAIVRHIVELHGGTVSAASPGEEQGSTFTVVLPLHVSHHGSDDHEPFHPQDDVRRLGSSLDQSPKLEGVRVLVVDDEPNTRELMREVLELRGAEVRDAGSARQGIEHIRDWQPDVIVSDVGMPEEDGYDFIREVRKWEETRTTRIPAIALTAYARSEDRVRALVAGYQVHLAKPIEPMELVLVISSLVSASRSQQTSS